jgi:hypothetical protein
MLLNCHDMHLTLPTNKYYTKMKVTNNDKHTSLLQYIVKKFYSIGPMSILLLSYFSYKAENIFGQFHNSEIIFDILSNSIIRVCISSCLQILE